MAKTTATTAPISASVIAFPFGRLEAKAYQQPQTANSYADS